MPGNRKITMKNIDKTKLAHPYSRKAHQIKRVFLREGKLERKRGDRETVVQRAVDKVRWFQEQLDVPGRPTADDADANASEAAAPPPRTYPPAHIHALITRYLARHDEDIAELVASLRPGRPSPPKLALLRAMREAELDEYATAGVEVPDLADAESVQVLRSFSGDFNALGRIRMVRVVRPEDAASSQ